MVDASTAENDVCAYVCESIILYITDRASTIPSKIRGYQPSTWPQRGTKVNGPHVQIFL